MNQNKKLALNSIIQIIGKVLMTIIGLVSIKILTFYLGKDSFGEYNIITNYLIFWTIVAELGLNVFLTTEISTVSEKQATKNISNIFTLRVTIAFLVLFLSSIVVWFFNYSNEVKLLIPIGAIGAFGFSVSQVLVGVFQKHLRTDKLIIGDLIARATLMIGMILLVLFSNISLFNIVLVYTLSGLLNLAFVYFSARKYYKIKLAFDYTYWKYLIVEAIPLFIIVAFNLIYYRLDGIMLSIMKTPADVGLYGIAYKVLEIIITFPGMFIGLLLPIFAKYYFKDKKRFDEIFQKSFNLMLSLAIPITVAGILLSEKIILLMSDSSYLEASNALKYLFVAIGCIFIGNLLGNVLIVSKHQKVSMYISIFGAFLNIGLNLYLIPEYSFVGAAIATAITEFFVLIAYLFIAYKYGSIVPKISKNIVWVGVASIFMGLAIYNSNDLNIFIQSLLGIFIFVIIMSILGIKNLKSLYKIDIQ